MRRKKIILIVSIFIAIVIFYKIQGKSTTSKEIVYNGNNLQISVDGESTTNLPSSGNYYLVDYDCKSDETVLTWNRTTYQLEVTNGNKKGGVACYLNFQSNPKLTDMEVGSYVSYTGNFGCSGDACSGQNANYVSDNDMGYCYNSDYKFYANGWRLGYVSDGTPYLISAGSPECMCTNSNGTASTNCSTYETTEGVSIHLANLNNYALKYCNQDYAYGGVCNSSSSWNMNATDFQKIVGKILSNSSCYEKYSDKSCGYTNDLIDNGGYYWLANPYSSVFTNVFYWYPRNRYVESSNSGVAFGIRPVLRLESSVLVIGGSGTYVDPYRITNNNFLINGGNSYVNASEKSKVSLSLVGSNVSQMCISVGTSGCSNYVNFTNNYTLDWSSEEDGEKVVYVYYKDSNGNVIASMNRSIILDTTSPKNNKVSISDGSGLTRTLTIFSTDASKMCFSNTSSSVVDCTNWVDYATSYNWILSDGIGTKTVYAFFKDMAGNVSNTTATVNVTSIVEFIVSEDFSDATFDSNIIVTEGETYPWTVVDGRFQSTNQSVNSSTSSSVIQFTPTVSSVLSFDYGVSSEANYDKLTITLTGSDGSSKTIASSISGTKNLSVSDIQLTSGVTYTLMLTYVRDSSSSGNSDFGYIDNLSIQS